MKRFKKQTITGSKAIERWSLWYSLRDFHNDDDESFRRIVNLEVVGEWEALRLALAHLKKVANCLKRREFCTVHLFPPSGRNAEDQLFRLPRTILEDPRKLLQSDDPLEYFIRGYGPEVAKKLDL